MHLIDLTFHMLLPSRCGRLPLEISQISQDNRSFHAGQPGNAAGCLHPRRPRTGCHVMHMVLCTRRSTRCGVAFFLSHGLVTSREQIVVEQIVANPLVPQILDGVQHVPRERVQNLVGKQMVDVPVPQILEKLWSLLLVRSSATLVQASGDSTGGRAHNPPPLSVSTIVMLERGPYSCLVLMKMKHTHTCHSKARVRVDEDERATWMETPLRSSVLSFESCLHCHQVFFSSKPELFSLLTGTVLHSSCGSTDDSLASTARRGRRLPCSRAAQCGSPAGDGAVATRP